MNPSKEGFVTRLSSDAMKKRDSGQFYGETQRILNVNGITLTDTVYTLDEVGWHYHENAYFTFVLQGNIIEGNKKEKYLCSNGSLLFHNWQDPHYNIKPPGYARGFHAEISSKWFQSAGNALPEGSMNVHSPLARLLMYKIFLEATLFGAEHAVAVECLMVELLSHFHHEAAISRGKPKWVLSLQEILHGNISEITSLDFLSSQLNIHPVHLSRSFPKYFNCTLGEYIRSIRLSKAMAMLSLKDRPIGEIAHECGFADQSHMIKSFRNANGITPSRYKKLLLETKC